MTTTSPQALQALFEDSLLKGDGRGKAAAPLVMAYQRDLTPEDLRDLAAAPSGALASRPVNVKQLKHSHHLLARLIAEGVSNIEIHRQLGYDSARISMIRNSPAFEELIASYQAQESAKDLDFRRRMEAFGLDLVETMQERLEETPEKIPFTQLQEAAKFAFEMAGHGKSQVPATSNPGGLNFQIAFVTPEGTQPTIIGESPLGGAGSAPAQDGLITNPPGVSDASFIELPDIPEDQFDKELETGK